MTAPRTTPTALLAQAGALLLDFDGPLADLMPPPANALAADAARAAINHITLPPEVATTTDHLAVLRHVIEHHSHLTAEVEHACTRAETEAAQHCSPSAHAENLFTYIRQRDLPAAVVSNNSEQAVRVCLDRHDWTAHVAAFSCRDEHNCADMKPSPVLLEQALHVLGIEPSRAVFIGDSVSDVQAATAAGVRILGLAKNPRRGQELIDAGAAAVASLADTLDL
ncbi:MAG: HAD family hydrolase [Pseudonocardiaceae bacterium]